MSKDSILVHTIKHENLLDKPTVIIPELLKSNSIVSFYKYVTIFVEYVVRYF